MEIWFFAAKANSKVFLMALIPIFLYLKTSITTKRENQNDSYNEILKTINNIKYWGNKKYVW